MKKITLIITFVTIIVFVSGCKNATKPESVVANYLKAFKSFDLEKAASYTVSKTDPLLVLNVDIDKNDLALYNFYKSNAKKLTFKIKESRSYDSNAVVFVHCKYIDGTKFYERVIGEYLLRAMQFDFNGSNDDYDDLLNNVLKEMIPSFKSVYTERLIRLDCIKIDDVWMIEKITDDMGDILTLNLITVTNELGNLFHNPIH